MEPVLAKNNRCIAPNDYQTVLFKPLSGLLTRLKFTPLRYCPITIELELASDYETPVISKFADEPAAGDLAANKEFLESSCKIMWAIQNVQIKVDVVSLDNSVGNSYAEHVLSGKALPINYNTYISQMQSLLSGANGQKKVRLNVTRALS